MQVCKYAGIQVCKQASRQVCKYDHCEVQTCLYIHPRNCRFFFECNYCKFGTYCRFKHESSGNQDTLKEIEDLRKALEKVNQKLIENEEEIKRKKKIKY